MMIKMIKKIKCFFGFHEWEYGYIGERPYDTTKEYEEGRKCYHCKLKEHYDNYYGWVQAKEVEK